MLSGGDDQRINDYFIERAFPAESDVTLILNALEQSEQGLTKAQLEAAVNLSQARIERVLEALAVESPAPLAWLDGRWVSTLHPYDAERRRQLVERITQLRREEQARMNAYSQHGGCLMEFLAKELDDPTAKPCGCCAPCQGRPEVLREVPDDLVREAAAFLRRSEVHIPQPREWPAGALPGFGWQGIIESNQRAEPGRAMCFLCDSGWGTQVWRGKYQDGKFGDELVEALVGLIKRWRPDPAPSWVTCVPSLQHEHLMPDLAQRLSARLSLPFVPAVRKDRKTLAQKGMENSWQQAHNLDGAFQIDPWDGIAGPVLLLDDIVDSGWTFTVVAALLRLAGSGPVFPLALAANR